MGKRRGSITCRCQNYVQPQPNSCRKQEVVTHLFSLIIQHRALVLPESVWLWEGAKGTSRACREGTEKPKSGSAWWCKARGWEAMDKSYNMRGLDGSKEKSFLCDTHPTTHRGSAVSLFGGCQDLSEALST